MRGGVGPGDPIRADVVDITADQPRANDAFLVDSNVWIWLTSPKAIPGKTGALPYQTREYPRYVQEVLNVHGKLHWCGLSLAELAHRIEQVEFEIYKQQVAASTMATRLKEYRHDTNERVKVVRLIESAWATVKTFGTALPITVDGTATDAALVMLAARALDGYDVFIVQSAQQARVNQILTDDSDYASVPGITLFTANRNVIARARQVGKLHRRSLPPSPSP